MLSRRLIRIKAFKILFSKTLSEGDSLKQAEKELLESCRKSVELYAFLLSLPVAVKRVAEERIEIGLQKFNPTPEEANPNRKFVNNQFISLLESDEALNLFLSNNALNWAGAEDVVKEIFRTLKTREYYREYMESDAAVDMVSERRFIQRFFENEIEDNESLHSLIEERSLYWSDDIEFVTNVILQNIPQIAKNGTVTIPEVFIKEDDREFALKLLTRSLINYDEFTEEISANLSNWDLERLVSTDVALVVMGLTEAQTFDTIPLKATINEYVEISKFYSTSAHNSSSFVNGLLDKLIKKMVEEGSIVKSGRGLVGGYNSKQ